MPASSNAAWMALVLAVRQPDSAPTWANPTTSSSRGLGPSAAASPPLAHPARATSMAPAAAIPMSFFISVNLLVQWCRRCALLRGAAAYWFLERRAARFFWPHVDVSAHL